MQPDALGQRGLQATGPTSPWNPAEEELNRFDGTMTLLAAPRWALVFAAGIARPRARVGCRYRRRRVRYLQAG
jgi:hypothetical protein